MFANELAAGAETLAGAAELAATDCAATAELSTLLIGPEKIAESAVSFQ
jgi:hypothetical protein